jgi:hypothetical protein
LCVLRWQLKSSRRGLAFAGVVVCYVNIAIRARACPTNFSLSNATMKAQPETSDKPKFVVLSKELISMKDRR